MIDTNDGAEDDQEWEGEEMKKKNVECFAVTALVSTTK